MPSVFETNVRGPQASPITPKGVVSNATVDTSKASTIQAVAGFGTALLGAGLQARAAGQEAQAESAKNNVISSFIREQMAVGESVNMVNGMSSQAANTKLRANLSRYLANNPSLITELKEGHAFAVETSGVAKIATQKTNAEKQQIKKYNAADDAGWILEGYSDAQKAVAVETHGAYMRTQAQIADLTKLQTQKLGAISLSNAQVKQKSQGLLAQQASQYSVNFSGKMSVLRKRLANASTSEIPGIIDDAKTIYSEIDAMIAGLHTEAGAEYIGTIVGPMTSMKNDFIELATGNITTAVYENNVKQSKALQQSEILSNEVFSVAAGFKSLIGEASVVTMPAVIPEAVKYLKAHIDQSPMDVFPTSPEGRAAQAGGLKVLKDGMRSITSGTARKGEEEILAKELNSQIKYHLKSVEMFGPHITDPKSMIPLMDFLGSAEFRDYNKKTGGLPPEEAMAARDILIGQYRDVISAQVIKEYAEAREPVSSLESTVTDFFNTVLPDPLTVEGGEFKPLPIEPEFTGSSIRFRSSDPSNRALVNRAAELTKSVGGALNRAIRASAALAGTSVKEEYEKAYAWMFEVEENAPAESTVSKPKRSVYNPDTGEWTDG